MSTACSNRGFIKNNIPFAINMSLSLYANVVDQFREVEVRLVDSRFHDSLDGYMRHIDP